MVLTSAVGQASARERASGSPSHRRSMPVAPSAGARASDGRRGRLSALGVLTVATLAAFGMAAVGTGGIAPAAARGAPTPLGLAAGQLAPAVVMPAAPSRIALVFALSEPLPPDRRAPAAPDRASAQPPLPPDNPLHDTWQEAVVVPDRPETVAPVPASAVAMPADPPASKAATARPVQKPIVVAHADAADAPPPVVHKPAAGASSAASGAAGDGEEARSLRSVKTVAAVTAHFASLGYDLDAVRSAARPVPRIYLESLPRDLARIGHVATKKTLFVQAVLPVVLRVNEELVAERWRAEHLGNRLARHGTLSSADRKWLLDAAELYGTKPLDVPALLNRMDIVPPSLAIAQAAEESGWGTSRFVLEGNALFGQYTYKSKTGMVPMRRDADRQHRVRRYEDLLDAARSYAHNLNTHWAYEDFRRHRSGMRRAGSLIGGYELAGKLWKYSERRAAYIETIRRIIRQNRLDDFDRAWLGDRRWTALTVSPRRYPI